VIVWPGMRKPLRSLREDADTLIILTPHEVANLLISPTLNVMGHEELEAASHALEHLMSSGVLFRYDVQGEMRSINEEPCR
jgi:hypothetical protein